MPAGGARYATNDGEIEFKPHFGFLNDDLLGKPYVT